MTVDPWTLGSLKEQLRTEFGLDDTAEYSTLLTQIINRSQQDIIRRRPNWPWQRKELSLDIPDDFEMEVSFARGQTKGLWSAGGYPEKRQIMIVTESTGDQSNGYMVTDFTVASPTAGTITIQSQFRQASVNSATARAQTGYIQLPEDFIRFDTNADLDDITGDRLKYRNPTVFESYKRNQPGPGIGLRFYTVKSDPLGENNRMYLCLYPFVSTVTTLQGEYYFAPPRLEDDNDEPIIPPNDRATLFYWAAWLFAQKAGERNFQFYRDQAITQLGMMTQEYELSDDLDIEAEPSNWIPGPANYPDFDDPGFYFP